MAYKFDLKLNKKFFIPLVILSTLTAFAPLTNQAWGQKPLNRSLTGTVKDSKTSDPVIGATVLIKGTATGTASDINGNFTLDTSSDTVTLSIHYIGYDNSEVFINLVENNNIEVLIEPENIMVGNVVVAGRRRTDTETSMVATIRNASQVTSGISAAQISKGPDRSASEVVRRIPGITIIDDRFVIVRGLSQRYNNAWLNGMAVPSTETDSRAFSFDIIPSSQIDNLLVYKSPSPEIPGDFSGGFVQISTKGIPDTNSINLSYTTGFNVKTQFNDFRINPGSSTDFLGFDLNKRPLSKNFPSHLATVKDNAALDNYMKTGFNNDWRIRSKTPLPDQRLSFVITRRFTTKNDKAVGNITAINYSNTNKTTEGIQNRRYGIYSASADKPVLINNYTDNQYSNDVRLGAMHNWSVQLNPATRIEFKNLFNILGRNRLSERTGTSNNGTHFYSEQTEMLYSSRLNYNGQLAGIHTLKDPRKKLDWNVGYSYANRNEPDRRIVTNQAGIGSDEDIPDAVLHNETIERLYQKLNDHIVSAGVNFSTPLTSQEEGISLKTGAYAEYRDRDYTPRSFIYDYSNLTPDQTAVYLYLPFQQIVSQQNIGTDKIFIRENTERSNAYSAVVSQQAIYAAVDITLGKFRIYTGVRAENYNLELKFDNSNSAEYSIMQKNKYDSFDILPSANISYYLSDKHILRAAYGRSVNRAELRELAPSVYYDFDLFNEIGGNENLKNAYIDNVDLRWEYYPASGEIISVGLFFKHFKNPIEWNFIDMGGTLRYYYENALSADNYGIEVDIRKNLDFIGLNDLSIVLNAAYIDSNIRFDKQELVYRPDRPMQGQSPYVVNCGLFYQNNRLGISASALYNRIGKRIIGIGRVTGQNNDVNSTIPDSYEMPRDVIDLSISKKLGKKLLLTLAAKDVLSQDVVYKQFPKFEKDGKTHERTQTTRRYDPGQNISVGLSIKFD